MQVKDILGGNPTQSMASVVDSDGSEEPGESGRSWSGSPLRPPSSSRDKISKDASAPTSRSIQSSRAGSSTHAREGSTECPEAGDSPDLPRYPRDRALLGTPRGLRNTSQGSDSESVSYEEDPYHELTPPAPPKPIATSGRTWGHSCAGRLYQASTATPPPPPNSFFTHASCSIVEQVDVRGHISHSIECLTLLGPAMQVPSTNTPSCTPVALEYTTAQLESARINLEVFAKHAH